MFCAEVPMYFLNVIAVCIGDAPLCCRSCFGWKIVAASLGESFCSGDLPPALRHTLLS